ncbi:retrovirus-related pol polyprotein from transposon TNT 1-94 [Tanacetum coccineum]
MDLQDQGVIDSGCSRHMTGNMSYLTNYEEIDGGYVAFGGNPKGGKITGKGTIKTGNLDFENVYFVRELKFNLFSVSQMCDKKNSVLFNDTECIVLSPNFKLIDESQVLLRVPRKNNMYSVDLKNIVPKGGLTCLFAKATSDESKLWHRRLENLVDHKVKVIRCDNGTEFKNREMNQFYEMKGILRQFSVARTPQQNGVAERRNKTLIKVARTMLADSKLPTTFWAEAVNTACYVQNRVLVVKPHNMADEGFFVGYSLNSKAFRVFNSRTRIVEENLHIRFSESTSNVVGTQSNGFASTKASDNAGQARKETEPVKDYILLPLWTADPPYSQDPKSSHDDGSKPSSDDGKKVDEDPKNIVNIIASLTSKNIKMMVAIAARTIWIQQSMDLSNEKRAIDTKWVFRNKKDERGIVTRNKERLVAQGYTQEEGIDYDEVFAPVARIKAIRLFLAYASFKDFVVYQMDVKSAFLYGKIQTFVIEYTRLKKHCMDYIKLLELVYVDDIIFGSTKKELCFAFEKLMHEKFQMSSMGELTFFLGLQVKQKKDGIFISQDKYVEEILKKFRFTEVKTASTPMETQKPLLKAEDGEEVDVHMYRYQVNPKVSHLHAVKRIFRLMGLGSIGGELDRGRSERGQKGCVKWFLMVGMEISWGSLHALVDGKKIIITESTVRRDLQLEDAEGVDCLPNSTIFEQLTLMGENVADEAVQKDIGGGPRGNTLQSDEDRLKLNELIELFSTSCTLPVTITTEEITLAQALEALKTSKPKVKGIVFQEPSTTTTITTISSQQSQDKGKGIMIEEPMKPMKKKVQIMLPEEAALKLQAEFDKEERLAREKAEKEKEANIALIEE